jgi:hypothetical protein
MGRLTTAVLISLSVTACREVPTPPQLLIPQSPTSPSEPLPPPPPLVREITVGEKVEDRFWKPEHRFALTAPRSGTLTISLSWNPYELGTLLKINVEGQEFLPRPPDWSPVVGKLRVEAGNRYEVIVGLAGADWIPNDPFVLTTSLE